MTTTPKKGLTPDYEQQPECNVTAGDTEHARDTSAATLAQIFAKNSNISNLTNGSKHQRVSGTLRDGRSWEISKFTTPTPSDTPFSWYNAYIYSDDGQSALHAVFLQGGSISKARLLEMKQDTLPDSIGPKYKDNGRDTETDWHEVLKIIDYDLSEQASARTTAQAQEPHTISGDLREGLRNALSTDPALAQA